MRIAIIGLGRMGKIHAETVEAAGHVFSEGSDLLADLAVVSSPDNTHASYVKELLRHGTPVFCEKPIATNMDDLDEIAELAKTTPLGCHLPLREKAGEFEIGSGHISAIYNYGRADKFLLGWRNSADYDLVLGGGIHLVDLLWQKIGPIKAVSGRWTVANAGARCPDLFHGEFECGFRDGTLRVDFTTNGTHGHSIIWGNVNRWVNEAPTDKTIQLQRFLANPVTDEQAIAAHRACIQFRACR